MTDELELLRAWDPPEGGPDPEAAGRARARLHAHIDAQPRVSRPAPDGAAPWRRRWWPLALAAAAVAIGVAVLSTGSGVPRQRGVERPMTAAQRLERAARSAERLPAAALFPAPDQFSYVRSEGGNLSCVYDAGPKDGYCAYLVERREDWWSFGHPGRYRSRVLAVRWPTAGQRRRWIRAGRPPIVGATHDEMTLGRIHVVLGNDHLSYLEVLAYRPTPEALLRQLRASWIAGQGGSLHAELFVFIADALRDQPLPAPLRAALVRALKLVPGVQLGGLTRDRLGRPALVVSRTAHGARQELLVDPRTCALLGERTVLVRRGASGMSDAPPGTVTQDVVYEQRGVVDRIGQRPSR